MKLEFNKEYFLLFLLLFITEVAIALYLHDDFIRPYFGDFLVVIMIYCFVMGFVKCNKYTTAFGVLVFAFLVELLQYINFVSLVNLQDSKLARTVIGTSFSVEDLGLYFLGYLTIIGLERLFERRISQ